MSNGKSIPIRRVFVVINENKPAAVDSIDSIIESFSKQGIDAAYTYLRPSLSLDLNQCDVLISVGGDGTLLGLMPHAVQVNKPLLGVNCGRMGFLTTFSVEELIRSIPFLKKGNYETFQRHLLQAEDVNCKRLLALNDVVLKSEALRLVPIAVFLESGVPVTHTRSDGMIFCTSTGSTAYNLSAHGPVLHPDSSAWCMTPICPHDFFNRTIVFDASTHLLVESDASVEIVIDGQKTQESLTLPLKIGIAKTCLSVIHPKGFSYFRTLREKFNW